MSVEQSATWKCDTDRCDSEVTIRPHTIPRNWHWYYSGMKVKHACDLCSEGLCSGVWVENFNDRTQLIRK